MKLEHITALAVRIFAISLGIYVISSVFSELPYVDFDNLTVVLVAFFFLKLCILLLAVYLWYFPLTVSKRLVSFKQSDTKEVAKASADELQIVAFSTLGIYFLYHVIADIFYWFVFFALSRRPNGIPIDLTMENKADMLTTGFEFLIVLFLLFGSQGVVKLIRKTSRKLS